MLLLAHACLWAMVMCVAWLWWRASGTIAASLHPAPYGRTRARWRLFSIFFCFAGGSLLAAGSGQLSRFDAFPPNFLLFLLALVAGSVWLSFSRVGAVLVDRATAGTLVGAQSFRILAELLIVAAHHAGIAPAQMSIEGYNYDIVTGVAAMLLYFVMRRRPSRLLGWAFNAVGLGTLANVVLIAVVSMPTRFQVFTGSSNLWVTQAPWALLPGVGVVAALVLHLILTRKLLHEQFRKA